MLLKLLLIFLAGKYCTGQTENKRKEINLVEEDENFSILDGMITVLCNNKSEINGENVTVLDEYLKSHFIRIKSPLEKDKFYDFQLTDLIPVEGEEGRQKKRPVLNRLFVPIIMAIKMKVVAAAAFMISIAIVAFKGFWAGMTALVLSKILALKLLTQPQNHDRDEEPEEQEENQEEEEEQDEYYEHYFSHHPVHHSRRIHFEAPHHKKHEHLQENIKPIVIYLNSQKQKSLHKFEEPLGYYKPSSWNSWTKEHPDFDKQTWKRSFESWENELK